MYRQLSIAAALIAAATLAGCASTSWQPPSQLRTTEAQQQLAQDEAQRLLAQPLGADEAVALALSNSHALQAALAQHAAALAQARDQARLPNPVFAFERLLQGEHKEITRVLTLGLAEFITWPQRQRVAQHTQQAERLRVASTLVQTTFDVRRAWIEAVSAQQKQRYFEDVLTAAQAAATLAQRMHAAGNFNRLTLAREERALLDARNEHTRAVHAARATRERLVRALSLTQTQAAQLKLPERLPDLPTPPRAQPSSQTLAARLDMQLAQAQLTATARELGLTQVTRWIDGLHVSAVRKVESGDAPWRGYEIALPLPIFDWGDAREGAAQARYVAQLNHTAQVGVEARSQLIEAHQAYLSAHDVAQRHVQHIAPLRDVLAEENLLRYNGMLVSVFDLLAQARAHAADVVSTLDAQREFWLADAQLTAAMAGLPTTSTLSTPRAVAPSGDAAH